LRIRPPPNVDLRLGWKVIHRGYADLNSVFAGEEADLEQLGAACIRVAHGASLEMTI
jgi:hypothetical protein